MSMSGRAARNASTLAISVSHSLRSSGSSASGIKSPSSTLVSHKTSSSSATALARGPHRRKVKDIGYSVPSERRERPVVAILPTGDLRTVFECVSENRCRPLEPRCTERQQGEHSHSPEHRGPAHSVSTCRNASWTGSPPTPPEYPPPPPAPAP